MQSPWGVLSWSACGYCKKIPKSWTVAWCENFQCPYFLHESVSVTAWNQSDEMRHHPHLDCLLTLLESIAFMQMLSGDVDILPLILHIIYIHLLDSSKPLSLWSRVCQDDFALQCNTHFLGLGCVVWLYDLIWTCVFARGWLAMLAWE